MFSHIIIPDQPEENKNENLEANREEDKKGDDNDRRIKVWVFGMLERGTFKARLFTTIKRDASTLETMILNNIEPGSTIYSDLWGGYAHLRAPGFDHHPINKGHCFAVGDATTNRVESLWSQLHIFNTLFLYFL